MRPFRKPIKILYIAHEGGIDGSNTSLRLLILRLKSIVLIDELILTPTKTAAAYYESAGLKTSVMPAIYTLPFVELQGYGRGPFGGILRQAKGIIRWRHVAKVFTPFLKSFKPDIVHLNEIILVMHAEIAHNLGFPVIMHDRAAVAQGTLGLRHALLGAACNRWVDAIIAICPSYVLRLGNATSIAHVIHNPFDIRHLEISKNTLAHNHQRKDLCQVLLVGARPEKGLFEAVQAMELAKDCRLKVVGMAHPALISKHWAEAINVCTGYNRRVARWVASHPEAGKRIDFLGSVDNVSAIMAYSDIVIIPWTTPHFARPLIEAWLMKKPVIASNVDGVAEYCKDGVNSLIFPAGDILELAKALIKVSSEQTFAHKIGDGGYKTAKEFIGTDDSHLKVLKIYKDVLASRKTRLVQM